MQYTEVINPRWANAGHTAIDCDVHFVGLGFIPFTANQDDQYPHTVEIFTRAVAGDFGVLSEYLAPATPVFVQSVITMRQARLALLAAGLLDTVDAGIASLPRAAQIEWEYAAEVRRDNALIGSMATALGLTSQDLDSLFSAGAVL